MPLNPKESAMLSLSMDELYKVAKHYGIKIGDRAILNIIRDIIIARNNNVPAYQYKE